ncbi:tetratricopeptide repeat protein [Wenzhouxiangella sp. XN24]|uniref:tetratricopeptide repeat protein n=1 Tax=Wenzhouxiangella sp. XN24 TaxID=2713569 RepID=UPI0013EDD63A|nr:tetratricopeptide repeat protein [Wenzhouxiangella sp. XN24]NGX17687.1 hypothetical protein [Wenzhouxiangella sp. XN24]
MSLLAELKRRKVFRVAMLYVVSAWLVIEVAETVLPIFEVPDGFLRGLVVLLVIGFIPALGLAWIYELTPEGLERDTGGSGKPESSAGTGHRLNWATVVVAVLAIGFLALDRLVSEDPRLPAPEAAAGAAAGAAPAEPAAPAAADRRPSVAVLPFANMSTDPEQEFFADGMTEDILTRLAGVSGLRVISRTSVMRYKDSELSLPAIAAELGVDHVLEGSVRRAGDRVRITGQLIRAADDAHLWADSFDRELADIFSVQTEIAQRIAQQLELQLTDRDRQLLAQQGTSSTAAYEYLLRARALERRVLSTPAEIAAAVDEGEGYLGLALELDPEYAEAWALMTRVHLIRSSIPGSEQSASEHWERGVEAARRAIRVAPDRAAGYVALGRAFQLRGQHDAALEQFRLAADLEPGSAEVLHPQGVLLAGRGELLEALEKLERAVALEPGDPGLLNSLASVYMWLADYDAAEAAFRRAFQHITPHPERLECVLMSLALEARDLAQFEAAAKRLESTVQHPSFGTGCMISFHFLNRDFAAAAHLVEEHRAFVLGLWPVTAAGVLSLAGQPADALIEAAEQSIERAVPRGSEGWRLFQRSRLALMRGQDEAALDLLERAQEAGVWPSAAEFALNPLWDAVRDDPRFRAIEAYWEAERRRMRDELAARRAAGA